MAGIFIRGERFGHTETQNIHREKKPCDGVGRHWSDTAASQGITRISGKQQKIGKRHGMDSPSQPPEGTNPVDTLISNI